MNTKLRITISVGTAGLCPLVILLLSVLTTAHMQGQTFEASGNGGFGVAERSGYGIPGVPSGGAAFGWSFAPAHKLQFDYAFGHMYYTSRTAFAGVVGGGITVELGRGAFVRPQFRTYIAPGPTHTINVTALPSLGFGWQF